ncbi:zinc ABC transporter substrate-binding protein [Alphaproteobacteria bacterium]|nr:zinc ABC transporter substrate-binding protein [Alphaproteobacteria bacterium]
MLKLLTIFSLMICFSFNLIASETKGVVTTIQPINSLVSAVIGNTGKTISLIPAEISPHEYKLKPSDTKKLQNANIIFFVSDHLESSVTKVFEILPKNIKIINLMEDAGIKHLAIRDNEAWERHDHHHGHGDHDDHDKHAKKHDDHDHDKHEKKHDDHDHDKHAKKHDDHDDHEKEDDVHIWLSTDNAVKIIKKINKELSLYFPENAETYDKNANQMIKEINQLKVELKKELSGIKDKPYIVFHDAYQYFETSFGLNAAGSVALEGDIASSPKQISIIKDKIVKLKASCVFQEPQFDSKLVKIVVEGTNAQIGTLDPLGINIKSGENFYLQLLKNMAKSLKNCLG